VRLFAGLRLFCLSLTDSRRAAIRSMTRPPLPAQPALLDLEAADDLVGIDALAGVLGHLVVANRRRVVLVEKVEPQLLRLGGRLHADGHAHEAERDGSAPDRSHRFLSTEPGCRRNSKADVSRLAGRTHRAEKQGKYVLKNSSLHQGVSARGRLLPASTHPEAEAMYPEAGENTVDAVDIGAAPAVEKSQEPGWRAGSAAFAV
jgi:hypothetical protein